MSALSEKLTIVEQIGEGGMARIFLAKTRGIGGFEKLVVVKKILPRLADDSEFIARFFQEARLAATLDHPNIVAVYDVDQSDGAYFYSMEYVRGRDLQQVIRRARRDERPLSFAEVVAITTGLCAGLHHAHTRCDPQGRALGIVHRDVSPSNVLVSFEGGVKLSDFGVAKARTGMVSTVAGTLRGKIPYMSPEQCDGAGLDRRSDVYAVGVLLWELLAGRRLHHGDSEIAMLKQIAAQDARSVCSVRADVPATLDRIVARALARRPADRYPSADALRIDLEEFAREHKLRATGRTIAELMTELFGDDQVRDTQARKRPATLALAGSTPANSTTPPTGTVAPVLDSGAEVFTPAADTTRPRRGIGGLAAGLAIGVLLGGGGLYLASANRSEGGTATPTAPPVAAPRREAIAESEPTPTQGPANPATATTPTTDEPKTTAAAGPPSPPADEASAPAAKPAKPRRKKRRRRAAKRAKALDLDSALPPGLDSP